ncbi:LysR family transcriptional regulator [Cohaesibacter gelatinilyticus]|uniref:Transcriptional regulator, LysR family n=1 Tax=Cohaesibacter gelatinilyticus TaxID=372072 RepID=A0A285PG55_9HYPH|nr:LysR family transcriptional regulator [Cohaesibacter gelatinilyticus]SNZ20428.1 transcriptional regulator, LysR family [Cohaesibacter gelatinilyticus]
MTKGSFMLAPRRYLPSISSLLALEAVDRLGAASEAAKELSLTQSAISRQLRTLEGQLGMELLVRDKKRLSLTPAAKEYVQEVRLALQQIAKASLKIKANPYGGSLNLAILPAFGLHWLSPRLGQFASQHPEVTINLGTRLQPFEFAQEGFDAAIHFGVKDWPNVDYQELMTETVVPVCAPHLLEDNLIQSASDLLEFPLLHLETRPAAWEQWLAHHDLPAMMPQGMLFDQFATMAQAAIHGMGIALLPEYLIASDLEQGRLKVAYGRSTQSLGKYYLVWPKEKAQNPSLTVFRSWLADIFDT